MSKTGLQFYRKSQSMSDLENERPKSIEQVRQAIRVTVKEVEGKLTDIERSFYGGQSSASFIRKLIPHVREIVSLFQITYVNKASQVEEIINHSYDPTTSYKFDLLSLSALKEYHYKIIEFVPGKFNDLTEDVRKIVGFLEKYCKSFFHSKPDELLETSYHYECRRQDYKDVINKHLQNITNMSQDYMDGGLGVKHFGLHSNEIARSCDCGYLPFLLVFPEAVQNIHNACAGVHKWLQADEQYTDFLEHDLTEFDTRMEAQKNKTQAGRQRAWMLEHKAKGLRADMNDLEKAITRLAPREKQFLNEIEELEKHIRFLDIDIELQEHERERILEQQRNLLNSTSMNEYNHSTINSRLSDSPLKTARDRMLTGISENGQLICTPKFVTNPSPDIILDPIIAKKRLEEIATAISKARYDIPAARKQIAQVKGKMSIITDKKKAYQDKKTELKQLEVEVTSAKAQATLVTGQLKRLEEANHILKDIYCKKTSKDLPKKIFHKLPVTIKNSRHKIRRSDPGVKPKRDTMDRVTSLLANNIKGDWQKLYRKLPFYPPRGETVIDDDLDRIIKDKYRTSDLGMARESLTQWRRQHTLANVGDIKTVLEDIQRADLLPKVTPVKKQPAPKPKANGKPGWEKYRNVSKAMQRMAVIKGKRQEANRTFLTQHKARQEKQVERDLVLPDIVISSRAT